MTKYFDNCHGEYIPCDSQLITNTKYMEQETITFATIGLGKFT